MNLTWKLKRDTYRGDTTLGKMYDHNGNFYCYVLEDVVRPYGVKDKTRTAIPDSSDFMTGYRMAVMPSGRYGEAVTIYTRIYDGVPILESKGVSFSYIRCHGGNDAEDSEGCLLVNKNRDVNNMTAWGSMLKDITKTISDMEKEGHVVYLEVINLPQEQ